MNSFKVIQSYIYHAILGFAVFAVFAFSMSWLYYNFFDGYSLPYVVEPIEILNPNNEIPIGDTIVMKIEVNKPENIALHDASVDITCDDGNLITLKPSQLSGTIPIGTHTLTSTSYTLPAKATIGSRCQFNFINTYRINPYVEKTVVWSSEQFKVMRGAE